ncbi:MAG: PTS sugar transporter subunit IIA [Alphaproteobacteria bacterium]|nr:PTS sugar transporter subunit IIA [Alphaproteobacteria bacterium]
MKIADILNFARIQLDVPATSKKQVLETISNLAADSTGCERQIIFDALVERERLGTTGIGKGVAIPHARLAGLKDLYCLFMRVNPAVDFESVDGKAVDLIFCLLVPEESGADHLKALARISKLLRNDEICAELRSVRDPKDVLMLVDKADNE